MATRSILDPKFKYRASFDTDVGRHLRAHRRAQAKAMKAKAAKSAPAAVVRQILKRSGT